MDFPCLHAPLVRWSASMRKLQILSLFQLIFQVVNTSSLHFQLRMYVLLLPSSIKSNSIISPCGGFFSYRISMHLQKQNLSFSNWLIVIYYCLNFLFCSPLVRFQCQKMGMSLFLVRFHFLFLLPYFFPHAYGSLYCLLSIIVMVIALDPTQKDFLLHNCFISMCF